MNNHIKLGLITVTTIAAVLWAYCKITSTETIDESSTEAVEGLSMEEGREEIESAAPSYEEPILNFMRYVANDQIDSIAHNVSYPFRRPYPLKDIYCEADFVARYDEVIDAALKDSLANNPSNWSTMAWRGIMYGRGDIWFDYDGWLFAVNYETELSKKLYEKAVKRELQTLHPSITDTLTLVPILTFRSLDGDWIGRIDYMNDAEYTNDVQMALFRRGTPLDSSPDYLIQGEEELQGSAHNRYYFFQGEKESFVFENPYMYEVNKHPINLCIEYGKCNIKDVDEFDKISKCELIYWQDML